MCNYYYFCFCFLFALYYLALERPAPASTASSGLPQRMASALLVIAAGCVLMSSDKDLVIQAARRAAVIYVAYRFGLVGPGLWQWNVRLSVRRPSACTGAGALSDRGLVGPA